MLPDRPLTGVECTCAKLWPGGSCAWSPSAQVSGRLLFPANEGESFLLLLMLGESSAGPGSRPAFLGEQNCPCRSQGCRQLCGAGCRGGGAQAGGGGGRRWGPSDFGSPRRPATQPHAHHLSAFFPTKSRETTPIRSPSINCASQEK